MVGVRLRVASSGLEAGVRAGPATCNNFQQAVRPRYIKGLFTQRRGKKRRIWSCLMVLPVITEGWPVEGPAGTHIVPAVEFEPSRQADV